MFIIIKSKEKKQYVNFAHGGFTMEYKIKKIQSKADIDLCNEFEITNYKWRNVYTPKVVGKMGFIPGEGIFAKMTCFEENPLALKTQDRERVCDDSTMEIFLAFTEEGEELSNDVMYINFEFNSNAKMYAKYGKGRKGRTFISEELCKECGCTVTKDEKSWTATVLFPIKFLEETCNAGKLDVGSQFYCNFYKISETPEIEHYGSFSPIGTETPNFHVPIYFAKAIIVE